MDTMRAELPDDPSKVISIIVIVRDESKNYYLLCQKRDPNDPIEGGKLTIGVSGHQKFGEPAITAAHSEILEELGLKVSKDELKLLGSSGKKPYSLALTNGGMVEIYPTSFLLDHVLEANAVTLREKGVEKELIPIEGKLNGYVGQTISRGASELLSERFTLPDLYLLTNYGTLVYREVTKTVEKDKEQLTSGSNKVAQEVKRANNGIRVK